MRKLGKILLQADEARGSAVGPRGVKPVKRTFSSLQRLLKWTNVGNDVVMFGLAGARALLGSARPQTRA